MARKIFTPEQIIRNLREAEIHIANRFDDILVVGCLRAAGQGMGASIPHHRSGCEQQKREAIEEGIAIEKLAEILLAKNLHHLR